MNLGNWIKGVTGAYWKIVAAFVLGALLTAPLAYCEGKSVGSSKAEAAAGARWARVCEWAIDGLFRLLTGERGHCAKAIRAPSDGVIALRAVDSDTDVAHPVLAGEVISVRCAYIRATGTTVTGTIIGYA